MTIRIFNPEHDIALAANTECFSPPHAGRQLRSDLSYLPALWAEEGDIVIVDDIDAAESAYRKVATQRKPRVEFCTLMQIPSIIKDCPDAFLDVWGWDSSIRFQLLSNGTPKDLLPDPEWIKQLRILSGRQTTVSIIPSLRKDIESITCGESRYITDAEVVKSTLLKKSSNFVVKSPWSSSGRGVRYFCNDGHNINMENSFRWIDNVTKQQGGVMMEPYYRKVKDFAMEFSFVDGKVSYLGLSLFDTQNGAYTGNLLATEQEKINILANYLDPQLLINIRQRIESLMESTLQPLATSRFPLFFGLDMMIVARDNAEGFLLHPCVEINLRRNMGLLALAISPDVPEHQSLMRISYENKKYRFKIEQIFK